MFSKSQFPEAKPGGHELCLAAAAWGRLVEIRPRTLALAPLERDTSI